MIRLLVLSLMFGCSRGGASQASAREYVDEIAPLLDENGLVAQRLLASAADVYNGKASTAQSRQAWNDEIVPLSEHLRDQAMLVQPPPDWATEHKSLVEIWTARAQAYRDLEDAVATGNADLWKDARSRADTTKLREEAWFTEANKRLAPMGLQVDEFP